MIEKRDFWELHKKYSYCFNFDYAKNNKNWNTIKNIYDDFELNEQNKIPKIIHQVWLGKNKYEYDLFSNTWKNFCLDGWEYKLWTDDNIEELELNEINKRNLDKIINIGMKSDFIRYLVLQKFGGIYFDVDFENIKNINDYNELTKLSFFSCLTYSKEIEVAIGVIGSVPNHLIINNCIDSFNYIGENNWFDIFNTTGSWFFTKQILNYINSNDKENLKDLCIFPVNYFYSFPNNKRYNYNCFDNNRLNNIKQYITPETYAIHWWCGSWLSKETK